MSNEGLIALIDLGDTLIDCTPSVRAALAQLREPDEREGEENLTPLPPHLEARRRVVMSKPGFWRNLPPRKEGFELLALLSDMGFRVHIVTKGPYGAPEAWADKVAWCRTHLPNLPVIVTDDKSRVHGHLLVDDWIPYVERWQQQWPTGFAVIPAQPWNDKEDLGPRCFRENRANRVDLISRLQDAPWLRGTT